MANGVHAGDASGAPYGPQAGAHAAAKGFGDRRQAGSHARSHPLTRPSSGPAEPCPEWARPGPRKRRGDVALSPGERALRCRTEPYAMTRRASGTERNLTHSCSPMYSPSTWNASGRARSQGEPGLIMKGQDAAAVRRPGWGQHLAYGAHRAYRTQAAQREHVKPGVECCLRIGVDRAAPQIRPGRRVGHNAEEQRADRRVPVALQRERGMAPVGHPVVLPQDHPDVEGGRGRPAACPVAVDRPHHLRVDAEAGVEGEVPVARPGQGRACGTALPRAPGGSARPRPRDQGAGRRCG